MSFLTREEKREVRSAGWYIGSRSFVLVTLAIGVCLLLTALSLLWWQPWVAKRHAVIQRQATVHSQVYVDGVNRQLELDTAAAEAAGDDAHLAAAAGRIRAEAGRVDWAELTQGNQAWLCQHGPDFTPADAHC